MKTVTLPNGQQVPALGMGTWFMGESPALRQAEIASLQRGIDLGMGLIDTAEMYGEGSAERLVGEALVGRREQVFLVSKVYPHNATRHGTVAACERSLARLKTDCIDLYLLHWRGKVPFAETIEAFEALKRQGKIRHWGVSNLDLDDMKALLRCSDGTQVATNQVLYNLCRRGVEWDLLPWCADHAIPVMAYSPIEQARLLREPRLVSLAKAHNMTAAQLALAWLLQREQLIAIPKAGQRAHIDENFAAWQTPLDDALREQLDALFPPPDEASELEML